MVILIFGISGQDGHYLQAVIEQCGGKVIGVSRSKGDWINGDVGDRSFVENLIIENQPEYIFHLAANSTTHHDVVLENHETIVTGTLNILESCYQHSRHSRIFLAGSAMQFENNGQPINEDTPFAASSPYAASRIAAVYAGRYYRSVGLKVYVGYFFNHDSPLRTERHLNQKIIKAVQRIAKGSDEKIEIGELSAKKEFNFAGDLMEAIWMLVNQDKTYEAVIGSGEAHSIEEWIRTSFTHANADWKNHVVKNENFTSEYKILVSDPHLIKSIGWQPKTDIKDLAAMMYNASI